MTYSDLKSRQGIGIGNTETMKDEEIIKRVTGGEKELYAIIIRRYNQRLYRIGLAIVNNESAIEDLMQTSYIRAYENLDKFRFASSFSTWITRILVNECLQYRKKKSRIGNNMNSVESLAIEPATTEIQTPLMNVINAELKVILEQSIKSLPEKYRTVFVMRHLENMSVVETMDCLALSEANVKVRLNRAKIMLRDKLKDYMNEDQPLQFFKPRCDKVVSHVMKTIMMPLEQGSSL